VIFLPYIPHKKLKEGAKLCLDNAVCLVSVVDNIAEDYSSVASFLAILAMEEIGKGIALIKKYDENSGLEEKEWDELKNRGAHKHKLKMVQISLTDPYSLLKPHELSIELQKIKELESLAYNRAAQLDRFKLDQLYVNWKDGEWISPTYYDKEKNKWVFKVEKPGESYLYMAIMAIKLLRTKLREYEKEA